MKIGKSNGLVCIVYDRPPHGRDRQIRGRRRRSTLHVYVGGLSLDWWRGLRHRPTIRWDRRGAWKAA